MRSRLCDNPPVKIGFDDLTSGFRDLRGACGGYILINARKQRLEFWYEKGTSSLLLVLFEGCVTLVVTQGPLNTGNRISCALKGLTVAGWGRGGIYSFLFDITDIDYFLIEALYIRIHALHLFSHDRYGAI